MNELDGRFVLAKYLAFRAGEVLKRYFLSEALAPERKADRSLVSEADRASERLIRQEIERFFPNDAIIGEEEGEKEGEDFEWVIDPLDGTNNFLRGIPFFNISIAVRSDKGGAGVVYNPITGEMFSACSGKGAFLNDKPLTRRVMLGSLPFVTYCSSSREDVLKEVADFFSTFRSKTADIRKLGSSALEICYVAAGRADVYLGFDIKLWDFAAAEVVARESGCLVREGGVLLVARPELSPWVQRLREMGVI